MTDRSILITCQPQAQINSELAGVIVGLCIPLRPELYLWTIEPTDPRDTAFFFLHNNDLRRALTERDGIDTASAWFGHLPIDQVMRIERRCVRLIEEVATTASVGVLVSPYHPLTRSQPITLVIQGE